MITERLLQFIWQFQYFNKNFLTTVAGDTVQVMFPGINNTNQGPDFKDARIRIGDAVWAGTVELHMVTSGWRQHGHGDDENYRNVILHVVWEHDHVVNDIPILVLQGRVAGWMLEKYQRLMDQKVSLPCEYGIANIPEPVMVKWKERLVVERLLRKGKLIKEWLGYNQSHWEETTWWLIARNFGMKVNAEAFEQVARSIPFRVLNHSKNNLLQLEALLFGQGGLLEFPLDDYHLQLHKEYRFLERRNGLTRVNCPMLFLRMRPGNFPTVRLAQLAALMKRSRHLFDLFKETVLLKDIYEELSVTASNYWDTHYRFGIESGRKEKRVGGAFLEGLVINTIVPLLFTYGELNRESNYQERALGWLMDLSAEANSVSRMFNAVGVAVNNSLDSQALLELNHCYCERRRCLDCAIGHSLLHKR